MKKRAAVRIALLLTLGLAAGIVTSCTGKPGNIFLKYSWVSTPLYLYDENPSIPATVYNGVYFQSSPGTYYMEYTAWDGSDWWMTYTLSAHPGTSFFVDGEDAKFEIALYSFGPDIYQWQSVVAARETTYIRNSRQSAGEDPMDLEVSPSIAPTDNVVTTAETTRGNSTLRIEYGRR